MERLLTTVLRRENRSLRTEQTYRGWLKRYQRWLGDRCPAEAAAAGIEGFLEHLAGSELVAYSTQRQALSALHCFYERALGMKLGKLGFRRARKHRRLPVVLSPEEVRRNGVPGVFLPGALARRSTST